MPHPSEIKSLWTYSRMKLEGTKCGLGMNDRLFFENYNLTSCSNIAAHKAGRSSLDYRLRDATPLRDRILGLLNDMEGLIREGDNAFVSFHAGCRLIVCFMLFSMFHAAWGSHTLVILSYLQ